MTLDSLKASLTTRWALIRVRLGVCLRVPAAFCRCGQRNWRHIGTSYGPSSQDTPPDKWVVKEDWECMACAPSVDEQFTAAIASKESGVQEPEPYRFRQSRTVKLRRIARSIRSTLRSESPCARCKTGEARVVDVHFFLGVNLERMARHKWSIRKHLRCEECGDRFLSLEEYTGLLGLACACVLLPVFEGLAMVVLLARWGLKSVGLLESDDPGSGKLRGKGP